MKTLLIILTIFISSSLVAQETLQFKIDALAAKNQKDSDTERLRALFSLYMDYQWQTYPEMATQAGKPVNQNKWTDFSLDAIAKRKKDRSLFLEALTSIKETNVDSSELLNYTLLRTALERDKEGEQFPSEFMPMNQMDGYHQQIMMTLTSATIENETDARQYIERLEKVPVLFDQLTTLMNEGLKKNIVPSKVSLATVPAQLQNLIAANAAESVFLTPLKDALSKFPKEERAALLGAATKSVQGRINPALERMKRYLERTYLPKARESVSLKNLPNGENWYNREIRFHTTTNLTYQEIHRIGLNEVSRIRKAMDSLITATGFKGSFQEFATFLRTDKRFYYDSAAQLLDAYRAIAKKIDPELPRFFGKLPRLPYGVLPVPAYDEKTQTTAYYVMGSPEAGRAGYFFANTYDLKSRPKWEMEALTIHEAVPGHHLQIALAQEMDNVPDFRKYSFYTAYIEGWGLYSESLGQEMGFYKDPYSKFGQLTYEMWRAIRLVVDTGIHGLGWSRQQAIDYFKENAAKTEHDIVVEIDRYITWPGQALAYKIGELKIKELRTRAARELGPQFSIRTFHDKILENGALPLDVLDRKINDWIYSFKK